MQKECNAKMDGRHQDSCRVNLVSYLIKWALGLHLDCLQSHNYFKINSEILTIENCDEVFAFYFSPYEKGLFNNSCWESWEGAIGRVELLSYLFIRILRLQDTIIITMEQMLQ